MASPASEQTASSRQLRDLVFDYLVHSCCPATARQFARDAVVSLAPLLDADGDEVMHSAVDSSWEIEETLRQADVRGRIRGEIMRGQVDQAISIIKDNFPNVLLQSALYPRPDETVPPMSIAYVSSTSVQPVHISLNLQTLAFIESARTFPLRYPPDPLEKAPQPVPHNSIEKQSELLMQARKLHAAVKLLRDAESRSVYAQEMENVAGALAYPIPETSAISKYFSLERRQSVAEQVDRAILASLGSPVISKAELLARNASVIYAYLNELHVDVPPSTQLPGLLGPATSRPGTKAAEEQPTALRVPLFDMRHFVESRT